MYTSIIGLMTGQQLSEPNKLGKSPKGVLSAGHTSPSVARLMQWACDWPLAIAGQRQRAWLSRCCNMCPCPSLSPSEFEAQGCNAHRAVWRHSPACKAVPITIHLTCSHSAAQNNEQGSMWHEVGWTTKCFDTALMHLHAIFDILPSATFRRQVLIYPVVFTSVKS